MTSIMKYETDNGEITLSKDIVKKYLVSGQADRVTDQEVVMFMQMCKYQNLNPFLREAYLIKFGNSPATMVTGKDTFVKRAAKSDLCTGYEAGVIVLRNNEIDYRKGALILPNEELVGGWAKIHRRDWKVPLENTVGLDEYARKTSSGKLMSNWAKMPGTMIRKVALVQALREAIPEEFSGLYSPEEMPVDDSKLNETPIDSVETEIIDEDVATEEQLNTMYSIAKEKELDGKEIVNFMKNAFNKESSKELTKEEAGELIETLKSIEREEPEEKQKEVEEVIDIEVEEVSEDKKSEAIDEEVEEATFENLPKEDVKLPWDEK